MSDSAKYPPGRLDASAPPWIWLQVDTSAGSDDRDEAFPSDHEGVTWCEDSVGGLEVPYVRADLAHGDMRQMASAPEDGTPVLLKFKAASDLPEKSVALADRWFVGANRGDASEWSFAAPVGYGGIPAAWIAGWMPTPDGVERERSSHVLLADQHARRPAADTFLDFFRDHGEALFASFGVEAVDLFNAAQAERRSQAGS